MPTGTASAVVGLHWGDEGKGKVCDLLAREHDVVVRYNGGANAGNSVVVQGERFALHLIPTGVLNPGTLLVVGNGVVVDPAKMLEEIAGLEARGVDMSRLFVSDRAHVVLPHHKAEDELREAYLRDRLAGGEPGLHATGSPRIGQIGTTKRGIGPCYADKVQRAMAVRVGDLLRPDVLREKIDASCGYRDILFRELKPEGVPEPKAGEILETALAWGEQLRDRITDTTYLLHERLAAGDRVLFTGANATLLDVDHGTYPFVTSSSCSALGIGAGTGVPTTRLGRVLGVAKAYCTRVGAGPFPTELTDELGDRIRERGREYGTTTGRPRRCGWLDLVATRYAAMLNGATGIALTMLDVLSGIDRLRVCVGYRLPSGEVTERFLPDASELAEVEPVWETLPGWDEDLGGVRTPEELPPAARSYVERIAAFVGVPVELISVGPDRTQTIEGRLG